MPAPELDVPHWARHDVERFRKTIPWADARITDRMIYAAMAALDNDEHLFKQVVRDMAIAWHVATQLEPLP